MKVANRFRIDKNRFLCIVVSLILIMALVVLRIVFERLYNGNLEFALSICVMIAIGVYVFLFYCCSVLKNGLINVYSCMLLMSFLFYFGQHLVVLFGKARVLKTYYRSILDGRIPDTSRIGASFFVLICMLVINIGVLFGCDSKSKQIDSKELNFSQNNYYSESIKRVAWIVLAIVVVPTLYKYYNDVVNTFKYGYSEALGMTTGSTLLKICYFLSYFFLPSIYLLLISYSNSKKKTLIILIYLVYVVLYLMTGSRFRVFESVIAIVLIYNDKIKQIKGRDLIKLIIIGVAILAVFSIVRDSREAIANSGSVSEMASKTWDKISDEGLLTNVLIETGSTFEVVDVVLYKTPDIVPYSYGFSIIGAVVMVLPSFLRNVIDINSLSTSLLYSPQYTQEIKIGMGSSFIAESYHNFGYFSIIYMLFIGFGVGKLMMSYIKNKHNNFYLYKYVYISSLLCFAIRTDLVSFLRYYVYYVLLFHFMIKLHYDYTKRKARL
ncbi:O-antigen polysaccharide polymerase Wzy [Ruminococcus sp. FC2018]|uniref:O-antigen polysaccharide polymerase Wzy n=1 Tax=Ruminococcus sp. FC2018 TaxID=1410617 RepID=UPI00048B009E|nr:O-antigen polysaccharide polymerase Wzy [Ruminococcus sp. FC2018]